MRNTLIAIGLGIVALLLIVVVAAAAFVDVNRFRPDLERAMTSALGRKVAIGHIQLSLLSGSASAEQLSIADDPAFGDAPFVTAKSASVGIDLLPLIFSRTLRVKSFRLEDPELALRRSAAGTWNFSNLGASHGPASSRGAAATASSGLRVAVNSFAITHGRVTIQGGGQRSKSRAYEDVDLEVRDVSSTTRFPFRMSVRTPGGGTMTLDGAAGPFSALGVGATPLDAKVDVKRLDLASTGIVEPDAGIAGLVDLALRLVSDGRTVTASGTVRGDKLQMMPGGAPAGVPVEIVCQSDFDLNTHTGTVKQGDVHVGKAVAALAGRYETTGESPAVHMKLSGKAMPAADLQAILPAVAVSMPQGARLQSGTVDTDLTISGPLDRLVIAGPVKMSDARLTGFDLGSSLHGIGSLAALPAGSDTIIQTLAASLRIAPDGLRADAVKAIVPTIGELTGEGVVAPSGGMNFHMFAKLTHGAGAQVTRMASLGRPENGVPFRVEGTMAKPVFVPDVGRAVANLVNNPKARSDALGFAKGLIKKKN